MSIRNEEMRPLKIALYQGFALFSVICILIETVLTGDLLYYVTEHGLQTPNEAFFHQNPKLLGLGKQFGEISFEAFGVFSVYLSAPILLL